VIRYLQVTGIAFFVFLSGVTTAFAQSQWRYEVDRFGNSPHDENRRAVIEQKSTILGSTCSTRLQFTATQDHGKGITGPLALYFTVSPMSSIKGFDFEYFDGPFSPLGNQKLMTVTVTKGGRSFIHRLGLTGYLSSEHLDDGFVFETSNLTRNKQGEVRKLLDEALQGAESLEVAVVDGKDHTIVLSATFPLMGSKTAIEALLKGI